MERTLNGSFQASSSTKQRPQSVCNAVVQYAEVAGVPARTRDRRLCPRPANSSIVEGGEALELVSLLGLGGAGEFEAEGRGSCCGSDRKVLTPMIGAASRRACGARRASTRPGSAALVAGLHRAEHAAAFGEALELCEHGLLDQVGQLVDDDERAPGWGSRFERPHSRLMISWMARRGAPSVGGVVTPRRRRWCAGCVVVERDSACSVVRMSLKPSPARAATGPLVWTWYFELLAALVGAVAVAHRDRPDAAGDAADGRCTRGPCRC